MSSSYSRNSTTNPKTLCVVCRDAGKTEKEYTSHFVKDQPGPNGKVVCPTLLNQACRICGETGHTSSYCSQYRPRRDDRRDDRREERYIEREPRRDIEREEPRREDRRDISYNRLHEDTERREYEIRERDEQYQRAQERRSKPWLQAAIKPRREPYAHPHGPRVRLNLETTALCASKHSTTTAPAPTPAPAAPVIDVRKVELHHAANWGDEDTETPFVCDPAQMTRQFFEKEIMAGLTTKEEFDFIAMCDDQSQMPIECGE
jgi:hypothetical protein